MPEGDTVWRSARHLHEALAGRVLTRSDFRVPRFATLDLTGRTVDEVVSRGKHLLMRIGDVTVHSHLKMEGSWRLYRPGTPWRRPAHAARAILENHEWQAVGFWLGTLEVIPRDGEDAVVGHLGPDLLADGWDDAMASVAAANLRAADAATPAAVALLDQRNLAGLGNEYVNELLFLRGYLPTRPVGEIDADATVALARRLLVANAARVDRAPTGRTGRGEQTYVYRRAGAPCRRCGSPIREGSLGRTALEERIVFWCPVCQT